MEVPAEDKIIISENGTGCVMEKKAHSLFLFCIDK